MNRGRCTPLRSAIQCDRFSNAPSTPYHQAASMIGNRLLRGIKLSFMGDFPRLKLRLTIKRKTFN